MSGPPLALVPVPAAPGVASGLPEREAVSWRPRVDARVLRRRGRHWTACTAWHTVPLLAAAIALVVLAPVTAPLALILAAHAWAIPELYAARGAGVLRARGRAGRGPERRALLLLGDLIEDPARRVHERTGLVVEAGQLGVWVLGEAGAVLVAPGGRRVWCFCVRATGDGLPSADRIAHLLLALRCDERDFATVANLAFSGARWRLERRLAPGRREALRRAAQLARGG